MSQTLEARVEETQIIETTVAYPLNSSIVQKASEILFIDIDNPQERMKELLDYCDESQTPFIDLMIQGMMFADQKEEGLEDVEYEERIEHFMHDSVEDPSIRARFVSSVLATFPSNQQFDTSYFARQWLIQASGCREFSPVIESELKQVDQKFESGKWDDNHIEARNRLIEVLAKIDTPIAVEYLKGKISSLTDHYIPMMYLEKLAKIDPKEAEPLLLDWYKKAAKDQGRLTIANLLVDVGNTDLAGDLVRLTEDLFGRTQKEEDKDWDNKEMLIKSLEILAKMGYPQTEDLVFHAINYIRASRTHDLIKVLEYCGDKNTLHRLANYYVSLTEVNEEVDDKQKKTLQYEIERGVPSVIHGVLLRLPKEERISYIRDLVNHPVFKDQQWRLMILETAAYSPNLAPISNDTDFVNEVKSIILNNLSRLSNQEKRRLERAISANASFALELSQIVFNENDVQMINFATNILTSPKEINLEAENKIRNQLIEWAESDNASVQKRAIEALGKRGHHGDHQATQYLVQKINQVERFDDDTLVGFNLYVFKALRFLADRFSNRFLFNNLMNQDNSIAVRKLIVRSLVERGFFDKKMLEFFKATHNPDEERKYLQAMNILHEQGALPTYETVRKLALGEKTIEQMKQDFDGLPTRVEDISNDPYSLELWFAFGQPSHQFDSIFSLVDFRNIFQTVSDSRRFIDENGKVLQKMNRGWKKAGFNIEECKRIWQKGIGPQKFIIVGKGGEELITRRKTIQNRLEKITKQVVDLIPIAHLAGRIKGLTKGNIEVSSQVSSILSLINIVGGTYEGIHSIHKRLFSLFEKIENPKKDTEDQQSLYDKDRALFIDLLQEKGFLDASSLINIDKAPEDLMEAMEESVLKQLIAIEKGWRRIPEAQRFARHLNNLVAQFVRTKEDYLNSKVVPQAKVQIEFVPKDNPILFWRIGDARETCTSASGQNYLTIAGLYHDVSSIGFVITDSTNNRAIGHVRCQAGQNENGENALLVGGYYVKPNYPHNALAQAITNHIELFANKVGMKEVFLADDQYSDIKPSGYKRDIRRLVRLQGAKVVYNPNDTSEIADDVYSDFPASTEKLEKVHCFVKVKK